MHGTLPGRMVDLIRDGVRPADLRAGGDKAVRRALVSTAMSAQAKGWSDIDWQTLVMEPKSNLGNQLRVKAGNKVRSPRQVQVALDSAWDYAQQRRSEQPPWSSRQVRALAEQSAAVARDIAGDVDNDLGPNERTVLAYAAEQTHSRKLLQTALPRRQMLEATGLGLTALRTAIAGLESKGLLFLVERGKPSGTFASQRRANLYALPAPAAIHSQYRVPRPVVPLGNTCGAPTGEPNGAPAIPVVPTATDWLDELARVAAVATPEQRAAALRVLQQPNSSVTFGLQAEEAAALVPELAKRQQSRRRA